MSSAPAAVTIKRKGLFYGWYMVFGAMVNQMMLFGLGGQGFGTFILPLQAAFGWSKGSLSAAQSLTQVQGGLLDPIQGVLVDRVGPRLMVIVGMTLFGGGLVFLGFIHTLPMYYAAFTIVALGASVSGYVPMSTALNH